jgi:hypothetical protein
MEWDILSTERKQFQLQDTLPSKTIIQNWYKNKSLPWQTETKTIHDNQATTTEDSARNSTHRKQTKPQKDGKY